MQSPGVNPVTIDARYRTLVILWFAILASVAFLIVLSLVLHVTNQAQPLSPIASWTLAVIGTLIAATSSVPKRKMIEQAAQKQMPVLVFNGYIIAFAMSEVAGIIGLLLYFLNAGWIYIFLYIISVLFVLVHFPRRTDLLAASYKTK
jgi:hypothetical protein